jgi:hypothetical protein
LHLSRNVFVAAIKDGNMAWQTLPFNCKTRKSLT